MATTLAQQVHTHDACTSHHDILNGATANEAHDARASQAASEGLAPHNEAAHVLMSKASAPQQQLQETEQASFAEAMTASKTPSSDRGMPVANGAASLHAQRTHRPPSTASVHLCKHGSMVAKDSSSVCSDVPLPARKTSAQVPNQRNKKGSASSHGMSSQGATPKVESHVDTLTQAASDRMMLSEAQGKGTKQTASQDLVGKREPNL